MTSKKAVCVITGASRGLGESIALNFAPKFSDGSVIILMARNKPALDNVLHRVQEKAPNVCVIAKEHDQGSLDNELFSTILSNALEEAGVQPADFEQALLVNNAGSIEPLVYIRNLPGVNEISKYFNSNVAGMIALTSTFVKIFPATLGVDRLVINISSLAAVQPLKSLSLYCAGNAVCIL